MNRFFLEAHLIAGFVALFLGSLPFGLWIARAFGVADIRKTGSGNIGATNVARAAGWKAGVVTFILDAGKGAAVIALFKYYVPFELNWEPTLMSLWSLGLVTVLGHCFSPWLKFKGGKGVSTTFGILVILSPIAAATGLLAYSLVFYEKRIGSIASLSGIGLATIAHWVAEPLGPYCWIGAMIVFLIVLRHEKNLDALLDGGELRFD